MLVSFAVVVQFRSPLRPNQDPPPSPDDTAPLAITPVMPSWRRPWSKRETAAHDEFVPDDQSELSDGSLRYVIDKGGNDAPPYQEATGAPVERESPLGYAVGPVTIIFLNISKMIGTGVYSTRKSPLPELLGGRLRGLLCC